MNILWKYACTKILKLNAKYYCCCFVPSTILDFILWDSTLWWNKLLLLLLIYANKFLDYFFMRFHSSVDFWWDVDFFLVLTCWQKCVLRTADTRLVKFFLCHLFSCFCWYEPTPYIMPQSTMKCDWLTHYYVWCGSLTPHFHVRSLHKSATHLIHTAKLLNPFHHHHHHHHHHNLYHMTTTGRGVTSLDL